LINKSVFTALVVALVLATSTGICADGQKELTVFCAAGLKGAASEIGQIYENQTGITPAFNFDGAQVLRTQIENGAYADVFLSGSTKYMNALKAEGFMNNSTVSACAENWQAIIVPKDNPAGIQNLSDLAKPGVKIVMGTKDLPITEITMQILNKLANDTAYGPGYREKVLSNVISQETNINFIVSKVALGEADAAFAHKSEVSSEYAEKVTLVDIPQEYNVKSEYTIGVLNQSASSDLAGEFVRLVKSEEGHAVLQKYGFEVA